MWQSLGLCRSKMHTVPKYRYCMIAYDSKAVLHSQRHQQILLLAEALCSTSLTNPDNLFFTSFRMLQNSLETRWIFSSSNNHHNF